MVECPIDSTSHDGEGANRFMKILLVNKFLYPKGGAENYVLKLGKILESHGHQVQYFGLANAKNTVGNHAGAYVTDMDFGAGIWKNLHAPFRIIYCAEARRKLRRVLEDFQPDVVHLNNIHYHLTPSVILEAHAYRQQTGRALKIVYTAHDYQIICPSHGLFDRNYKICERCLGGNYLHCMMTRCIKHSGLKSLLGTLDACFWKWMDVYAYVDTIICCSAFLKSKLDTQERLRTKTVALHNFVDMAQPWDVEKGGYVLEFGHLSPDKGTLTLLEAARNMPDVRFVFAGYGPSVARIQEVPNGEYVGFLQGEELELLIRRAAVSVYPSMWYENCPFSVIESQMYGTPVVASRMGGIPELIAEGQTGELFEAGNAGQLQRKLEKLLSDPELLERYSRQCSLRPVETAETYYQKLMMIYGAADEDL